MKITGIICEYNPFHLGHQKQIDTLRRQEDMGIVCLMSGNYVQRGEPAIFDKMHRAKAAVLCGADLVLELPLTASLSSAEGFAITGVGILGKFCTHLSFGSETGDENSLFDTAKALLSPDFPPALRQALDTGLSFPAARQTALASMGYRDDLLEKPNDILAVEYCKAILSQNLSIKPIPILRQGDYHDTKPNQENPSATALRRAMNENMPWETYIPQKAVACFKSATIHTMDAGERAILARLRTMTDSEFEALPYGSEGLWRKLMHAVRRCTILEDVLIETKSKRYTRTRINRMVMCAYLGITQDILQTPAPYVRVLGFNDRGREILKKARNNGDFYNIGETTGHPFEELEKRASALYGLFSQGILDPPESYKDSRVFYYK